MAQHDIKPGDRVKRIDGAWIEYQRSGDKTLISRASTRPMGAALVVRGVGERMALLRYEDDLSGESAFRVMAPISSVVPA